VTIGTLIRQVLGASLVLCALPLSTAAQAIQGARFDSAPVRLEKAEATTLRPVRPMDLLTLRDPKGLSLSPDGKNVAFVVGQADPRTNGYRSALFVVSTSAKPQFRSFGTAGQPHWDEINQWISEDPEWSSDSKVIWYRARMEGQNEWQVWGWDRSSGKRQQVTRVPGDVESYRVRPGAHALFLTVLPHRTLRKEEGAFEPGILFSGQFRTYQSIPIVAQMRLEQEPAREYWIHDLGTQEERRATEQEVDEWKSNEPAQTALLNEEGRHALGRYHIAEAKESPDGTHVAYIYTVDDPAISGLWARRLLLTVSGSGPLCEVTPGAYFVDRLWWSADGATLYFTERDGHGHAPQLRKVSADGSGLQTIFQGTGTNYFSSFSPDKSRRSFAGLVESNTTPPQIAFLDTTTGQVRTLVDLNPSFRDLRLSPAERIEGTNRYGDHWYGYLVKPLGYAPGIRYPLIVTTYRSGDYFLRGASGDQNPIQVYAAKGFAVFCFDVGRSRNVRPGHFEETILEWSSPTASMEAAIDLLNNRGVIDPKRVGIAGFSHGEEIAGYAVLHTHLFRAAVGAALYDPCFYFMGGTEWWDAFKTMGLGGWPEGQSKSNWDEIDMPAHADRIQTAILENTSDTEYLIYLPLYRSLVDLGKPVELYIYPQELHVRNQPRHRFEIYERNLDWFLFWLKGEESRDPAKRGQYRRWEQLRLENSNPSQPSMNGLGLSDVGQK
jgi:dipeptidyl aminopeptidase/acylaminoacyl peptidase